MPPVAEARRGAAIVEPGASESFGMRLFEPGGATLEDAILDRCAELAERGSAECPVCGARLRPADGCEGCGSELS